MDTRSETVPLEMKIINGVALLFLVPMMILLSPLILAGWVTYGIWCIWFPPLFTIDRSGENVWKNKRVANQK